MSSHVYILYMCQQLCVHVWNEVNYKFIHNFRGKFTCELIMTLFGRSDTGLRISRQAIMHLHWRRDQLCQQNPACILHPTCSLSWPSVSGDSITKRLIAYALKPYHSLSLDNLPHRKFIAKFCCFCLLWCLQTCPHFLISGPWCLSPGEKFPNWCPSHTLWLAHFYFPSCISHSHARLPAIMQRAQHATLLKKHYS